MVRRFESRALRIAKGDQRTGASVLPMFLRDFTYDSQGKRKYSFNIKYLFMKKRR